MGRQCLVKQPCCQSAPQASSTTHGLGYWCLVHRQMCLHVHTRTLCQGTLPGCAAPDPGVLLELPQMLPSLLPLMFFVEHIQKPSYSCFTIVIAILFLLSGRDAFKNSNSFPMGCRGPGISSNCEVTSIWLWKGDRIISYQAEKAWVSCSKCYSKSVGVGIPATQPASQPSTPLPVLCPGQSRTGPPSSQASI